MDIDAVKEMLKQLANINLVQLPSPRFKAFLRLALLEEHKFAPENAETIAARMVVELGTQPMLDNDLIDMAHSYATFISNMRATNEELGFAQPERAIVEAAGQLTLKFS